MRNTFFASDFHFNHANIAGPNTTTWKSGYRDFSSVEKMNQHLLNNINSTVGEDDELHFAGDFCFGGHQNTPKFREQIICKNIFWYKGNHDKHQKDYAEFFTWVGDVNMITVEKQKIFISHYKHALWEGSHKGFWHLYGHSHSSAEHWKIGKSMDIGIDNAKKLLGAYRPFSFQEVKYLMDQREVFFGDHHDENTNVK